MDHHRFQGVDGLDGDIPTYLEARLLNNTLGKLFFCTFQILFYAIRPKLALPQPPRSYKIPTSPLGRLFSWFGLNWSMQVAFVAAVLYAWGPVSLFYLLLSVFLGGSLHPMAGHYIAEHYVTVLGQETYSYYGPLNM